MDLVATTNSGRKLGRARLISVLTIVTAFARAQAPTEFEVASIKQNKLNDRLVTIDVGPGARFAARGYTVKLLIQRAYGVMGWNITGGPGWLDAERFDVLAKAPKAVLGAANLKEEQLKPMLRAMLADRFKLRLHEESREMSGYALIVARGGVKAKPAAAGEYNSDAFRFNSNGLTGQISMPDFARYVAGKLGLVAVDQTGLEGVYDFKAEWTAEVEQPSGALPGVDPRDAMRSAVFAAVEKQLGLKFNPQKIAVRTLVIDSVEMPTEN
jgi:uncharacterized protein (TIGR03435 family)